MSKKKNGRNGRPAAVTVYSYPDLMYVWPLIFIGYLFTFLNKVGVEIDPSTHGWWWTLTLIIVTMTIGADFNRNVTLFILAFIGGIFGLNYYFEDSHNILLLGKVLEYFSSFKPDISIDAMYAISTFFLILYVIMFIVVRINNRWRITQNEIEHRQFGLQEDAIARAAKRVKARYPDILETILGLGSGSLIVLSSTGKESVKEIHNIPFLFWRMFMIDRILESKSMTLDEIAASDEEDEL